MNKNDYKKSINIAIQSIAESMTNGKEEIFAITEEINKENSDILKAIDEVKQKINNYNKDIESIKIQELDSRKRLSIVSSDFRHYTQNDIKEAYEKAKIIQDSLVSKEKEINSILKKMDLFENRIAKNNELVKKADELLNKIEVMSDYIRLDAQDDSELPDDIGLKWILFQEKEKSRIARDIHDGPAQTIASLVIRTDIIKKLINKQTTSEAIQNELEDLKYHLRNVIKEIRRIMYDLRPTSLDELGLKPSIEGLTAKIKQHYDINFEIYYEEKSKIKSDVTKIICFRVIQECLNNIVKHSHSENVYIELIIGKDTINLMVQDDGVGFDTDSLNSNNSFGLSSLRERVLLANGKVDIISAIDNGSKIVVELPNKEDIYA